MLKTGAYSLAMVIVLGTAVGASAEDHQANPPAREASLRVGVVGDTGIGERAFHWGFSAVQKALRESHLDVLLHLGDFVYQPRFQPQSCPEKYIREIQGTLVEPYPFRLFVPGDNDLPAHIGKPQASGCWDRINPLDTPFDEGGNPENSPALFEGSKKIGNVFFAILNSHPWKDPTAWLAPRIEAARAKGLWIILALHVPPVTTAWYLDQHDTVLKQVNALKPDLVVSGNQHSYERFHPLGIPEDSGKLPVHKTPSSRYQREDGTIHIVSGGGGATFKPFADQEGHPEERSAPAEVMNALAVRALMNHYIVLEISENVLKGTTHRVCSGVAPSGKSDPRWKPDKAMWENVTLECEGKPVGVTTFDQFEIAK